MPQADTIDLMRMHPFMLAVVLLLSGIPVHTASAAQSYSERFLTRAGAVELLLKASREVIPDLTENAEFYPDVVAAQPHTKYVIYATKLKMIDPEPERGLLFPYRSISRAEFLKMMAIAFGLPSHIPHSFQDIEEESWYAPFAGIASYYVLFNDATNSNKLIPSMRVSQGEAERALQRFFLIEPDRMPRNFSFTTIEEKPVSRIKVTPSIVKNAIQKLFKKGEAARPDTTRHEIIALLNKARTEANLPALTENILLRISAQRHAKDMFQRGYFSHTTPEGLDYVDRIRAANYMDVDESKCGCQTVFNLNPLVEISRAATTPDSFTTQTEICGCKPRFAVGENIAKGQLTPAQVHEDWMNSPGHRANILNPQFEEVGIGLFGDVWAQNFGRMKIE
ncbi:MAG: CAP domain-containing protein [Kiritimatiellales bacterium]|nr:CAP domain-containing protein [Kiritimatiellales bacterium]